jgi:hypothetical protein
MPYFQNVIGEQFNQSWPIDQSAIFNINANINNIAEMVSFNSDLYDFSITNIFTIYIAIDQDKLFYQPISVNVAGAVPATTRAVEVVNALNADALFANSFTAYFQNSTQGSSGNGGPFTILIRANLPRVAMRCYIDNNGAETKLQFNRRAPVKQLPTYFSRYTIANRFNYPDSNAQLIELNPLNPVDAQIIINAEQNPLVVLADWQLLAGRSNNEVFQKITMDGSGRIVEIIQYYAGSVAGEMALKIQYTYTGANLTPDQATEVPWTLQTGDLVIPPP